MMRKSYLPQNIQSNSVSLLLAVLIVVTMLLEHWLDGAAGRTLEVRKLHNRHRRFDVTANRRLRSVDGVALPLEIAFAVLFLDLAFEKAVVDELEEPLRGYQ